MRPRSRLLTLLALAVPAVAAANGVALPDTLNVALRPGNTTEAGIEANFGWLSADDGESFSWVCHETVLDPTSSLTPIYFLGQNATLTTVRSLGVALDPSFSVFRSADGCSWDAPADLENVNIRDIAFDPAIPDHVLAVSFTGAPATNGPWESDDAGATWHKTGLDIAERYFRSVEFSIADPMRVYATATWFQPTPSAYVYVSDDGGDTWTEHPWTFSVESTLQGNVDVIATSPSDANIAYARTNGGTDYLLLTTNGGVGWAPVFQVDDDIRGVVYEAETGAVWLGTIFNGTWRALDGRSFVEVPGAPAVRGIAADTRGIFVAANNYEDGFALGLTSNGGMSYRGLFRFVEITGPRPCPEDSDVFEKCEPRWPQLAQLLGITSPTPTPTPPGGDDDDGGGPGCQCSSGEGSAAAAPICAALLLLAIGAARRRAAGHRSP